MSLFPQMSKICDGRVDREDQFTRKWHQEYDKCSNGDREEMQHMNGSTVWIR